MQKILFNHLDGQFFKRVHVKARYSHASQLKKETGLILSVMAYAGHRNQDDINEAFSAAAETLGFGGLQLVVENEISLSGLDRSLQELEALKPLAKQQLLKACATSVVHDKKISSAEAELLRAFSDALGCPMPPIIPQSVPGLR